MCGGGEEDKKGGARRGSFEESSSLGVNTVFECVGEKIFNLYFFVTTQPQQHGPKHLLSRLQKMVTPALLSANALNMSSDEEIMCLGVFALMAFRITNHAAQTRL